MFTYFGYVEKNRWGFLKKSKKEKFQCRENIVYIIKHMAEWENYNESDGATLPKFFRKWILRNYGEETMALIDRGGKFHDWLTYKYPNTKKHNRKSFIKLLRRYKIPKELVKMINFGLWVYDISPNCLKKVLKRTV